MILYYDRQGKPIYDTLKWGKLLEDKNYKIVKQEPTPGGRYWVSTVWMGIDHSFTWIEDKPNPRPIIFETMVFDQKDNNDPMADNDMDRYSTEAEAAIGHMHMLKKWTEIEARS
jgi:hypothetical protein